MTRRQDSLAEIMAQLDPALTPLDAPPGAEARARMAALRTPEDAEPSDPRLRTPTRAGLGFGFLRRRAPVLLALAASLLVAVLAVSPLIGGATSGELHSAGADRDAAQSVDEEPEKLLMSLSQSLESGSQRGSDDVREQIGRTDSSYSLDRGEATVRLLRWSTTPETSTASELSAADDETAALTPPVLVERLIQPDGSVTVERRVLETDAAGEDLWDLMSAAGETPIGRAEPTSDQSQSGFSVPESVEDWGALLREEGDLASSPSAADYFQATTRLRSEHDLDRAAQAGLIEFLATLPGIRVDGSVADRLGRDGVSFSADSRESGIREVLVLSAEMGLIASERIGIGSADGDASDPVILEYLVWF
ncbi:hypothetical protein J4H92_11145 [Leucobacter weissii]|uniref:Uncharacterized protein n=1 Tax=Leucobacter weissii TaxID=1983706 RepID=A0A939SB08_9MICO|nr:hypothetical protein [Leucobacter weissii]MBO1902502.1 hypothetical protein [Leucobacter weissii]